MTTYSAIVDSPEVAAARPILAEVASTIADVQVRNRGTIGGNVCSNDPTNHFPPLLAALGAELHDPGRGRRAHRLGRRVLRGRLPDRRPPGRAADERSRIPAKGDARDGWAAMTLGKDGTGIVNVAATVSGGTARIAIGCVAATPVVVTASADETAIRDAVRAPTSTRPPTSTPPPTTGATSPRCSPPAPSRRRKRERPHDHVSVNGERYEREVEARKLLVHFIRDDLDLTGTHVGCDTGNCGACTVLLDGVAVKSCMLLAAQADGAEITTVEGLAAETAS